jgi:hypothetical protein
MLCLTFMHCHQVGKAAFGGENVSTFGHLGHPEGYSVQGENLSLHAHFKISMHLCRGSFGEFPLFAWVVLWWLLFSLSHELRVSFVCSLALVYVFRGELVTFVILCRWCWAPLPLLEEPAVDLCFQLSHDWCWALCASSWGIVWFRLSMIGVEPFVPLLEGSCILVSVVSSRCPCLWGPRHWAGLCGLSHAKW